MSRSLTKITKWFNDYVNGIIDDDYINNAIYTEKIKHSFRVLKEARRIAKYCNKAFATSEDILYISALLHDIGRFEQMKTYRTFNDAETCDHAKLSAKILKDSKILDLLPRRDAQEILTCIALHNKEKLPNDLSRPAFLVAKGLRDADKLDIVNMTVSTCRFKTNKCSTQNQPVSNFKKLYTEDLVVKILNGNIVKRRSIRCPGDKILFTLSWINEFNFKSSYSAILEREYIVKLVNGLPRSPSICNLEKHLIDLAQYRFNQLNV